MSNKYSSINSSFNRQNRKKIAIDLDGVCVKTRETFLDYIEDEYNIQISRNILYGTNPDIPETDIDFSTAVKSIVKESFNVYENMCPISGSVRSLRMLNREYQILIATHRVSENWLSEDRLLEMKDITQDWLDKHDFVYDDFIYPTPENKSDIESDIFIDDRPSIIKNVNKDKNKEGILFLRPHNIQNISNIKNPTMFSTYSAQSLANNPKNQWSIIVDKLLGQI